MVAIKKMKSRIFFLRYRIESCSEYCFENNHNTFVNQIIFERIDKRDPLASQYPRIYFDIRTNKVIGVWDGCYN